MPRTKVRLTMLKRINKALPQLLVTQLIWGVIIGVAFVWLFSDKLRFFTGLGIGELCGIAMAIHMAVSIEDAVSTGSDAAFKKKMMASTIIRYVILVLVLAAMAYFDIGSIVPAVLGVLGLKISAYLQPAINKLLKKEPNSEVTDSVILSEEKTE